MSELLSNKKETKKKTVAFIDYANVKAWAREKDLKIDMQVLHSALISSGVHEVRFYYGFDPENQSIKSFFKNLEEFGYKVITKPIQYFKVNLSTLLKQKTNKQFLEKVSESFKVSLEDEVLRLKQNDISLLTPKANFDVEIATDIFENISYISNIILFSGDGDFVYLFKKLKLLGKKVTVVSGRKSFSGGLMQESYKFVTMERLIKTLPELLTDKKAKPALRQVLKNCASSLAKLLGLSSKDGDTTKYQTKHNDTIIK